MIPRERAKHFKLMADVDLSGFDGKKGRPEFNIIGTPYSTGNNNAFTGVFDGDGHTISHLTITGASYLGLFGRLEVGAEVKNLGLLDVNITGSGAYVGALVGQSRGSVTNCCSTGAVSGNSSVGRLAGVNGFSFLSRHSAGRISNCYSTGSVSGTSRVGGLVGLHSTGSVTSSFWDVQTSHLANMCGSREDSGMGCDDACGQATREMQTAKTFLDAGWDFVGETANGTADLWWILEGKDYPRLWWETRN